MAATPGAAGLAASIEMGVAAGNVEEVLAGHLADPISIHHDPAAPGDGPRPAQEFAALLTGNPMASMVPDGVRTYGDVTADGDTVTFASELRGTTTAGDAITIANKTIMTVRDGRISTLTQQYPPEAFAALNALRPPG